MWLAHAPHGSTVTTAAKRIGPLVTGANVLVSNNGDVKLADFGLARLYKQNGADLTKRVVTLWYRAPELLLGQTKYTSAVDMWSAGCLFGEMLQHGEAMLKGKTELDQLSRIFKVSV